jgi:NADH-quinone oxidoreductase subunit K
VHPVIPYCLAVLLFAVGAYGVVARRSLVLILMAIELLLAAVTLVFVTAGAVRGGGDGQAFGLFVIGLATAELGIGIAIILQLYRVRRDVTVDRVSAGEEP